MPRDFRLSLLALSCTVHCSCMALAGSREEKSITAVYYHSSPHSFGYLLVHGMWISSLPHSSHQIRAHCNRQYKVVDWEIRLWFRLPPVQE